MSQLQLGSISQDLARLTCGHQVYFDRLKHPLRHDGWYASLTCPSCRRPREVLSIAYRDQRHESPAPKLRTNEPAIAASAMDNPASRE